MRQVWQLGSRTPNFTLEGHHKGVNSVDYYSGGDKPYLVSGADDHLVKIWDYQVQETGNRTASRLFLIPHTSSEASLHICLLNVA